MSKNKSSVLPFVVAVALGIVSIVTVNKYIAAQTKTTSEKKAKILVAGTEIPKGSSITLERISTKIIPLSAVSKLNIFVPLSDSPADEKKLDSKKSLVAGRIAVRAIPAGDPIMWSDLRKDEALSLSDKLPGDMRAVTIPVDSLTGVGFNIVPGDHVDILASKSSGCCGAASVLTSSPEGVRSMLPVSSSAAPRKKSEPTTYVLMQNVLVLENPNQIYHSFYEQLHEQSLNEALDLSQLELYLLCKLKYLLPLIVDSLIKP